MSSTHVNFAPSKTDFFQFVRDRKLTEHHAVLFWEYGEKTDWTMRDGSKVRNWRQLLMQWCKRKDAEARDVSSLDHGST